MQQGGAQKPGENAQMLHLVAPCQVRRRLPCTSQCRGVPPQALPLLYARLFAQLDSQRSRARGSRDQARQQ